MALEGGKVKGKINNLITWVAVEIPRDGLNLLLTSPHHAGAAFQSQERCHSSGSHIKAHVCSWKADVLAAESQQLQGIYLMAWQHPSSAQEEDGRKVAKPLSRAGDLVETRNYHFKMLRRVGVTLYKPSGFLGASPITVILHPHVVLLCTTCSN